MALHVALRRPRAVAAVVGYSGMLAGTLGLSYGELPKPPVVGARHGRSGGPDRRAAHVGERTQASRRRRHDAYIPRCGAHGGSRRTSPRPRFPGGGLRSLVRFSPSGHETGPLQFGDLGLDRECRSTPIGPRRLSSCLSLHRHSRQRIRHLSPHLQLCCRQTVPVSRCQVRKLSEASSLSFSQGESELPTAGDYGPLQRSFRCIGPC